VWLWPLAATPTLQSGLDFETNGLEGKLLTSLHDDPVLIFAIDPSIGWPPPDPDRIPRLARRYVQDETPNTQLAAFRKRQTEDLKRFNKLNGVSKASNGSTGYALNVPATNAINSSESTPTPSPTPHLRRRQPFQMRYDRDAIRMNDPSKPNLYLDGVGDGEETWRNSEGDGLKDFGLDEEAEFYDEDEVPLAQLLRSRLKT